MFDEEEVVEVAFVLGRDFVDGGFDGCPAPLFVSDDDEEVFFVVGGLDDGVKGGVEDFELFVVGGDDGDVVGFAGFWEEFGAFGHEAEVLEVEVGLIGGGGMVGETIDAFVGVLEIVKAGIPVDAMGAHEGVVAADDVAGDDDGASEEGGSDEEDVNGPEDGADEGEDKKDGDHAVGHDGGHELPEAVVGAALADGDFVVVGLGFGPGHHRNSRLMPARRKAMMRMAMRRA